MMVSGPLEQTLKRWQDFCLKYSSIFENIPDSVFDDHLLRLLQRLQTSIDELQPLQEKLSSTASQCDRLVNDVRMTITFISLQKPAESCTELITPHLNSLRFG